MSNDWIQSIKGEDPTEFEEFLYEMFERADDAHDKAIDDGRKGDEIYHQAEKDTLRRIFGWMNINLDVDGLIGSAPTNQIERKRVNTYQRMTRQELEDLQLAVARILENPWHSERFDALDAKLTAALEAENRK